MAPGGLFSSALQVRGPNGFVKNPALTVQRDAEPAFAQYGARFGLTPSDRTQLKVDVSGAAKGPGAERVLS
ncbi:P27 family phage terminase small subunit [Saccharopolyspora sp. NPDC050389]|uniref:P27 family phage terminase small subunit n=1 Tax=Saccharopolyspora sp. NPDC050389 TaxID=3155516 RepID=UPI003411C45B